MFFRLAAGSPSEYDLYFYDKNFKSAGVNVIQDFTSIYIGSQDYIDYPTEFYIVGDNDVKEDGSNPGAEFSRMVAQEVSNSTIVSLPAGMDLNDLYLARGIDETKRTIGVPNV